MSSSSDLHDHDAQWTRKNRERLTRNRNLLYWYEKLYQRQFSVFPNRDSLAVLEIGSGASPLRLFRPDVITSDVLRLDYLDHIFDCHQIDQLDAIADQSLDVITLTNVAHHLRQPLLFLDKATSKLKPGGSILLAEPYFSVLSSPIYHVLHSEPVDFTISRPELDLIEGPLSSANIAIPFLIFFGGRGWDQPLRQKYQFSSDDVQHYTSLAYMATGGISKQLPVPHWIYRLFHRVDCWLASSFPKLFSSFFIVRLRKR